MNNKQLILLLPIIITSCSTLSSRLQPVNSYNAGYNSVVKTCNNVISYSQGSGEPTSSARSLWGLLTNNDVGYANAVSRLSGQKDAINNLKPSSQATLYSQASFLDKCNFNPSYASYCKSAYKKYLEGYKAESSNLTMYARDNYIAGFNDGASDCDTKILARPPLTPIDLK